MAGIQLRQGVIGLPCHAKFRQPVFRPDSDRIMWELSLFVNLLQTGVNICIRNMYVTSPIQHNNACLQVLIHLALIKFPAVSTALNDVLIPIYPKYSFYFSSSCSSCKTFNSTVLLMTAALRQGVSQGVGGLWPLLPLCCLACSCQLSSPT